MWGGEGIRRETGREQEKGDNTTNRVLLIKAPNRLLELILRLRQEPARERAVRVEGDPQLAQRGEQQRVLQPRYRRIVPLVHAREHIPLLLAVLVHLPHVIDRVVAQPEARERAGLVDFVDPREGFGERDR